MEDALIAAPRLPASPPAGDVGSPEVCARAEPAPRRLEIPPCDARAVQALSCELGISQVLAQVLVRRGAATPEAAGELLEPPPGHPPEALTGIGAAVDLIRRHVEAGMPIVVHGDYDVDGVCATALMLRALRSLGGSAEPLIPGRLQDGYGLSSATIRRLAARGTRLIVTVDCGITAVEEVAEARAAGIDVVVSDHHSPRADGRLPDAPVVHPALCAYPCPDLCGTAVAYKLAQALGASGVDDDLELVALATVADLVPLRGENRRLVRDGLAGLSRTARPGLRALLRVSGTDPSGLDAAALGFRLAPRINAAGRLRRADAALELLLTADERRAGEIAAELDALNVERRELEQRILWEAEAQLQGQGPRSGYVLAAAGWHPGVVGIVASRLVERYHRPTVLVALGEGGTGQGSGRSVPGFDLLAALQAGAASLERFGGHRAAAGLTIREEMLPAFRRAFEAHADEWLTDDLRRGVERVDAVVSAACLNLELAEELERLEPCGMGNPGPKLLIPGARFEDVRTMGEGRHARFSVRSGGARARAVAFGCGGDPGGGGEAVDACFRLERNAWNGTVEPRLVLRSAQPAARGAIEVLGEPVDYLRAVLDELSREDPAAADAPASVGAPAAGRPGASPPAPGGGGQAPHAVLDRRGEGTVAVLTDVVAGGEPVLAVCADVPRRLEGLQAVTGGFSLTCHHAVERDPALLAGFRHIVVLDPPAGDAAAVRLRTGEGCTHLAWGEAELRFARQMHDHEYALEEQLRALYRELSSLRRAASSSLERLLCGPSAPGRPARLAARLVRVLSELGLVGLEAAGPELVLLRAERTQLHSSAAYREYTRRHQEGSAYLAALSPTPLG